MTTDSELTASSENTPESDPDRAVERPPLAARIIVSVCAATTMVGAYAADFNETHLFNPNWPPHARFHNAQTMLMATTLGACALFYAWRRDQKAPHLHTAILFAALYWVTNALSITFPGTAWADPNYAGRNDVFGLPLALVIGMVQIGMLAIAFGISRSGRPSHASPPAGFGATHPRPARS